MLKLSTSKIEPRQGFTRDGVTGKQVSLNKRKSARDFEDHNK